MELSDREHFRLNILRPLIESGNLLLAIPDKPTSPKQKYYTNPKRYKVNEKL
jgi:ATP-dependent DNA helicase RecG